MHIGPLHHFNLHDIRWAAFEFLILMIKNCCYIERVMSVIEVMNQEMEIMLIVLILYFCNIAEIIRVIAVFWSHIYKEIVRLYACRISFPTELYGNFLTGAVQFCCQVLRRGGGINCIKGKKTCEQQH